MKILYIAPLPPPITGHSLVSQAFLDHLKFRHTVNVINMGKNSFKQGINGLNRIAQVVKIIWQTWCLRSNVDAIYLTISESFAGNVKDLFLFIACFGDLSKTYVHLHGGSIKHHLWDQHKILYRINRFFYHRLGGVIISGRSHKQIFEEMVADRKIHIVPNFAPDNMFVDDEIIKFKFSNIYPLKILYISSMQPEKGYELLLQSYLELSSEVKSMIRLDFAGRFDSLHNEAIFRERVAGLPSVQYHGVVDGQTKIELYKNAHIFCLPTQFLEGQPISILEAYAAGCVVITTGQPGIRDIFTDGSNGFEIGSNSQASLATTINKIVQAPKDLYQIACHNRSSAELKFRSELYSSRLSSILESHHLP